MNHQAQNLLAQGSQFVSTNGLKGLSLRSLADGINTSARMLIHYFGTSEKLFQEIMAQFVEGEKTWATAMTTESLATSDPLKTFLILYTDRFTDPKNRSVINTLFEIYGLAILGKDGARIVLDDLLRHWIKSVNRLMLTSETSADFATVILSVANGLIFDFIATSDRVRMNAAIECFVASHITKTQSPH